MVGYSALMERDEAGTLARLKANRAEFFDPRVAAHNGRIFKLMGDGVLVEVRQRGRCGACAVEMQRGMRSATPRAGGPAASRSASASISAT